MLVNIGSKVIIRQFISFFVLAIFREIFLDSIICQVNIWTIIGEWILSWGCPDVSISIPISFYCSVDTGHHHIMSQIDLSLLIKKRSFNITLQNIGSIAAIRVNLFLFQNAFDILQSKAHFDALASIAVLSRFDNPCIFLFMFVVFVSIRLIDLFIPFVVVS